MKTHSFAAMAAALALSTLPVSASAQEFEAFSYEIPSLAQALPNLNRRLEGDRDAQRQDLTDRQARHDARVQGTSAMRMEFYYNRGWSVTGANEQFLSLSSSTETYSGGAHGNQTFDSLIWNAAEDREMSFYGFFTNRYRALEIIDRQFCPNLTAEQTERMGEESAAAYGCPMLHDMVIAPASATEPGPFTGFNILIAPYLAGSYADGSYIVNVEMTEELLELVHPEYRDAFAVPE